MSFLEHAPHALPTIKELFARTWGTYKRRVRSILVIYVLSALAAIVIAAAAGVAMIPGAFFPPLLLLPILIGGAGFVLVGFISQSMTLEAAIHDGMTWKHAWAKAKQDWVGLLWTNVITGLIMSCAFLLFFLPGLILIPAIQVFPYAFKIDGKKDMNALMYAHALVRGRWWKTVGRIVLFAILLGAIPTILDLFIPPSGVEMTATDGSLTLGIFLVQLAYAFFITAPMGLIFGVELYHDLKTTAGHISDEHVKVESKKWGWIAIAGAVFSVIFLIVMTLVAGPFMSELFDTLADI